MLQQADFGIQVILSRIETALKILKLIYKWASLEYQLQFSKSTKIPERGQKISGIDQNEYEYVTYAVSKIYTQYNDKMYAKKSCRYMGKMLINQCFFLFIFYFIILTVPKECLRLNNIIKTVLGTNHDLFQEKGISLFFYFHFTFFNFCSRLFITFKRIIKNKMLKLQKIPCTFTLEYFEI